MIKAGIIVVSDKCSRGQRIDISGEAIKQILLENNYQIINKIIVADEIKLIFNAIIDLCDNQGASLVITTGGTGFSKRDITPEATKLTIEKQVPGIAEAIRAKSLEKTDRAMLSRGISGIRKNSLIINLPGSEKAVRESLDIILSAVEHGLNILQGSSTECGR